MKEQNNISFPLFKPPTFDLLQEIQYSQPSMESLVILNGRTETPFELHLLDDLLVLYHHDARNAQPIAFTRLDFSVKFQRVLKKSTQTSKKTLTSTELIGFTLMNDFGEFLTIQFQSTHTAKEWVDELSKNINQTGFHKIFRPVRTLGKGSSATVYEIMRLEDGKRFAAKAFAKETVKSSPQKLNSLINELSILRSLNSDNLLRLESVFETQTSFYVIMETLNGGNLFEYLVKRKTNLTIEEIKQIMRSIVQGLINLEQEEIIHRDIKLENVMLRNAESLNLVIVDFGLAVFKEDEDYIYYNCGTPGYISPESFAVKKNDKINPCSDVFSLGVIFHVLLMGKYLFQSKDSQSVLKNNKEMNFDLTAPEYQKINQTAYDLLCKMLSVNLNQRISASECLQHDFLRCEDEKPPISPAATQSQYKL